MTQQLLVEEENIRQQIRFVSHEIRNHLSICDMYSQIIKRNLEQTNSITPQIENAINCIQQSLKIIGINLLDLKSINNNSNQIYDFEKILTKGLEMSKVYALDKEIDFEIFVKSSANIKVDENRFLSCIVNIIKNGIEAIDMIGKISVIGEIKDLYGIIRIINNGKPIPKSKQANIFNPGYTSKKCGSGLGLAICKKYFEEENCTLKLVKSTKAQTVFEIKVPIEKGNSSYVDDIT